VPARKTKVSVDHHLPKFSDFAAPLIRRYRLRDCSQPLFGCVNKLRSRYSIRSTSIITAEDEDNIWVKMLILCSLRYRYQKVKVRCRFTVSRFRDLRLYHVIDETGATRPFGGEHFLRSPAKPAIKAKGRASQLNIWSVMIYKISQTVPCS
jgi:hypothetical protein